MYNSLVKLILVELILALIMMVLYVDTTVMTIIIGSIMGIIALVFLYHHNKKVYSEDIEPWVRDEKLKSKENFEKRENYVLD